MKQAWGDLKSFLTILMSIAMVYILLFNVEVNQAVFALFSTVYGSMITFFFTKKDNEKGGDKIDRTQLTKSNDT